MQHAYDGYSRRGNFRGSIVYNMVLIYSSDSANICGSRSGDFKETGQCKGLKVVKLCSHGALPINLQTLVVGCIVLP